MNWLCPPCILWRAANLGKRLPFKKNDAFCREMIFNIITRSYLKARDAPPPRRPGPFPLRGRGAAKGAPFQQAGGRRASFFGKEQKKAPFHPGAKEGPMGQERAARGLFQDDGLLGDLVQRFAALGRYQDHVLHPDAQLPGDHDAGLHGEGHILQDGLIIPFV